MRHRARSRRTVAATCSVLLAAVIASCVTACGATRSTGDAAGSVRLTGPLASLLAASTDLGTSGRPDVSVVLALRSASRPVGTQRWAADHRLALAWQPGRAWAALSGPARSMSSALHVSIHDYRSRTGQGFYAGRRQAVVPDALRGEVTQVGRLLNFSPRTGSAPLLAPASQGLGPSELIKAYDANDVFSSAGDTTGTVVFFEWGPYEQADLDAFTRAENLPSFSPQLYNGTPTAKSAGVETELDVEVVHAIAPRARLVVVNADPTSQGSSSGVGLSIARLFDQVDQAFPGAVWSLSIGWGCESLYTGADLRPVETALEKAESHGTAVFDASGDTAGLECKDSTDYSTPPQNSDIGTDAVGSLPGITSVGGTRLSTDASGSWAAEQAWDDSALSQGGSGGVSQLQTRPSWQVADYVTRLRGAGHRLIPDVSADADPDTGVSVVLEGDQQQGGGTSQAAPIWAGFTVLMDEYLRQHGGRSTGALNPLLYTIAQGASRPAFHDITLGGDAIDLAQVGYDLVTGLGSPMIDNLVQDILTVQKKEQS